MKIEIWLIYLQLRRFFTALKTFIWANVVCRKMKSPTKRIFYHFGSLRSHFGVICIILAQLTPLTAKDPHIQHECGGLGLA